LIPAFIGFIGVGFQITNGSLVGHVDMFAYPVYDYTRKKESSCNYRIHTGHGPFEPHRLPMEDM